MRRVLTSHGVWYIEDFGPRTSNTNMTWYSNLPGRHKLEGTSMDDFGRGFLGILGRAVSGSECLPDPPLKTCQALLLPVSQLASHRLNTALPLCHTELPEGLEFMPKS